MRIKWALLLCFVVTLCQPLAIGAGRGDLSIIIESFLTQQFPESKSHFWVVNGTQWQALNEVIVDVNTVVLVQAGQNPTENRYLLLIVGDQLAAAQNIPIDAGVDCKPEHT